MPTEMSLNILLADHDNMATGLDKTITTFIGAPHAEREEHVVDVTKARTAEASSIAT